MSRQPYPFAGPSARQGSAGPAPFSSPNSQRRYYDDPSNADSSTNLLGPGAQAASSPRPLPRDPPQLRTMANNSAINNSPYTTAARRNRAPSIAASISDKFAMSADPVDWGASLNLGQKEPDDSLHHPDPKRDRKYDKGGTIFTTRGIANLGCLLLLALAMFTLFAGYPVITYFMNGHQSFLGGFNLGGTNATGQVPKMPGNWGLIDLDTPKEAYYKNGWQDSSNMQLVFSDEFTVDGRTFYPGDDPYWEAVDLHYWGTNNLEWYDPAAVTTKDGAMHITLSAKQTHDLDYQGGMVATWNKFCFTGGLVEAAVTLPGANNIVGLWPAVWTMGNLGRAGFGASLEGMWPYTYDACDVGALPNQTMNGLPLDATINGDQQYGGVLSFLPGQKLSRCTCPGENHPGPVHSDGSYVGRAAPEIDIFEAQISGDSGFVSQSGQWAPFNAAYEWFNDTGLFIADPTVSELNTYTGGAFQQATSVVSQTNQDCYELEADCFAVYGIEYKPGYDDAYITWINDDKVAWSLAASGMVADTKVEISARPIPQEPMYILANLGMSRNFGDVDLEHLTFPATMKIDYIRVYQRTDSINIGCDPEEFPTAAYINQYLKAYTDANLTTWRDDFGEPFPKNNLIDTC